MLAEWQHFDFNRSVVERRSHLFFRGLANDRPYFRALKTPLGSLSEWDKPAALMAAMCLPLPESKTWLAVAVPQLPTPFAATSVSWLQAIQGTARALPSAPPQPQHTHPP